MPDPAAAYAFTQKRQKTGGNENAFRNGSFLKRIVLRTRVSGVTTKNDNGHMLTRPPSHDLTMETKRPRRLVAAVALFSPFKIFFILLLS